MRSFSRQVSRWMHQPSTGGRVLGRFRRAVDLLIGDKVLALVTPEIGDGPFNVVVPFLPQHPLPRHFVARAVEGGWDLGAWSLRVSRTTRLWDARPPWARWPAPKPEALCALRRVLERAASDARFSPVAVSISGPGSFRLIALDRACLSHKPAAIRAAAAQLAGWGPGLTPSGDDYLAGVMLGLWSVLPDARDNLDVGETSASRFWVSRDDLCRWIYQAAAPRTNRISRAFLNAAREGLADVRWHALLRALAGGDTASVERAARRVLDVGATSGLDMLIGFLRIHEVLMSCEVYLPRSRESS